MRANTFNTGIASEYLILSKLYRLELEAYISQGNKKNIDITVIKDHTVLSIDVKSVRGYSSLIVNNVLEKENHYIVFVTYNNKFNNIESEPTIYIVPSNKIKDLAHTFKKQKRIFKKELKEYCNKWDFFTN